jgi:putative addiction module component (TIGR02574 family)
VPWSNLEEGHDQASIDKAWDDELARRARELDEGRAEFVEWDEVKATIARRLGER